MKRVLLLFLIFCVPLKSFAQEFEWVYNIKGVLGENNTSQSSAIVDVVTNSDNEIYALGRHVGTHDFGIQTETAQPAGNYRNFILKLDENKNVLWVKKISPHFFYFGNLDRGVLALDDDENILIGGNILTNSVITTISLDPEYHVAFNPVNTHENLLPHTYYGFVLKLDEQGNYIDSTLFENIFIEDVIADNHNDIVVVGATTEYHVGYYGWLRAYICKLDSNLNFIWDKTYSNNGNPNGFFTVGLDSQNNIYCQGSYLDNFTFGGVTHQNSSSEFVCKLSPNGTENWINELESNPTIGHPTSAPYAYRKIYTDTSDNIFFFSSYSQAHSYQFSNTTINNLPLVDSETVLFKMDINGNHIWNIPFYGAGNQNITDFELSASEELILVVNSSSQNLHYADDLILETNGSTSFLLKINQQGGLIDFKRLDINPFTVETDTDYNIILGGQFKEAADFDPHPFDEYNLYTNSFIHNGNTHYEGEGFVLKLSICDVEPLFLQNYDFCASVNSPTIGDIEPSDFNISWYNTASSQTPLDDDFLITDGAIYYMEKIAQNCPVLLREPVQMNILPPVSPPIFTDGQPCYFQGMKLQDLAIQGEDLTFYDSLGNVWESNITINPNTSYFVSQTVGNCESELIAVNINNLNLITYSQTASICDNEKDNAEIVNLSDYVPHFVSSLSGFLVSHHTSYYDAFNGTNSIQNYQNYQTENNQTVYIRFYSEEFGCFEIVELIISLSLPPEIIEIKINDLAENNSITVLPYNENYVYSLNGINYQNSNYFDHLTDGEYFVYVKDKDDGCEPVTDNVFLLAYPKFFTPNGDGINDYWHIKYAQHQELLNVEIYDRYGKLITSFDKNSTGWDGTLNGKKLLATDYWFKITRIKDQKIIYRGHFSLVR